MASSMTSKRTDLWLLRCFVSTRQRRF